MQKVNLNTHFTTLDDVESKNLLVDPEFQSNKKIENIVMITTSSTLTLDLSLKLFCKLNILKLIDIQMSLQTISELRFQLQKYILFE